MSLLEQTEELFKVYMEAIKLLLPNTHKFRIDHGSKAPGTTSSHISCPLLSIALTIELSQDAAVAASEAAWVSLRDARAQAAESWLRYSTVVSRTSALSEAASRPGTSDRRDSMAAFILFRRSRSLRLCRLRVLWDGLYGLYRFLLLLLLRESLELELLSSSKAAKTMTGEVVVMKSLSADWPSAKDDSLSWTSMHTLVVPVICSWVGKAKWELGGESRRVQTNNH